jgi:hypothetical protein
MLPTLKERLSAARFAPYEAVTRGDATLTLELYEWNMRTAAVLFEDLGAFEVLLRNSIDMRMRARYGGTKAALPWYRQVVLSDKAKEKLQVAIDRVTDHGSIAEDPDGVVAELSFGFWRFLLSRQYQGTIWPIILPAFKPPGGARIDRRVAYAKVDSLHFLRNRVAHHEPIFTRDLQRDHGTLMEVAGWMCPDTRDWIAGRSQVPAALGARPTL